MLGSNCLDICWVGVAHGNTAHVDTTLNVEESFVAPGGVPRVLNNPVVHAALISAVSYSEDGVVDIRCTVGAVGGVVGSRSVVHEVVDDLEGN